MIDREKVLDALMNCLDTPKCRDCPWEACEQEHETVTVPFDLLWDALALLKEQDEKIATMRMVYGSDVNVVGEIVRCKDCKRGQYQRNGSTGIEYNYCTYRRDITPLNWYCADGERRDADA